MRGAGRGAQHDQVTGALDLDQPVAEDPPEVVLGADLLTGQLGDGVHGVAAGDPDLDRPELLEVTADRGLRHGDAVGREQLGQLRLVGDAVLDQQPTDAVLTLLLAGHQEGPPRSGS